MTSIEDNIMAIILSEIKDDSQLSNWHGVDVKNSLIVPYLESFDDSFNEGQKRELYVVLKESHDRDGYYIVYDDKLCQFGLGLVKSDQKLFIGFYGNFKETLLAM